MKKIGVIICGRYNRCGAGKCLRAMREREGGFSIYSKDEPLELVGFSTCGGCPGGNIEYVPAEMIKNGAEAIHLATCLVVGYPPCPRIKAFKEAIEKRFNVPVVVGSHPLPTNYWDDHAKIGDWKAMHMDEIAPLLFDVSPEMRQKYN